MAKKTGSVVNISLLSALSTGAVTRVSQADGIPLINHNPPLIEINTADVVDGNALARLTDAGKALLPNGRDAKSELAKSEVPRYAVISGLTFVPAEKKSRGRAFGGGAPTIYPWAAMEVGGSFFVGVSEKPDPVKSMTSAVSSANMKYSEEYGEEKPHTRAKRGVKNRAVLDDQGNKIMETVMRRDRKPVRKFELREVKAGDILGNWTAPEDGVLIGRTI
jgi:hypothetical protein